MGLPIIIVWGILIPTISFIFLTRHKRSMNTLKTKLKFGLIYFGFIDKKYYWEFIILFRKLVLITLSVFVGNYSRNAQALMILATLIVFLYIQLKCKPYATNELNSLETYYILVSAVTVYAGLYHLTVDMSKFYYRY
jgi:glucose-6-phosphate-specific signal transduction histidine kinase